MSDRFELIARIGAAIADANPETQAVLREALARIVEDHGVIAAHERRKAKDRQRKHSADSTDSVDSKDSVESVESVEGPSSPQVSSSFPEPHITPSSPPPSPTSRAVVVVRPPRADVEAVVAHYVQRHPKRRPGEKDRKLIARHLGTYAVAELCEAIDGNAEDEWAQRTGKHELTWVLRDNGQIDTYRAKADVGAVKIDNGWFAESAR